MLLPSRGGLILFLLHVNWAWCLASPAKDTMDVTLYDLQGWIIKALQLPLDSLQILVLGTSHYAMR